MANLDQQHILLLISFFGGIVPAFIWLFFWLRQDIKHPEPGRLIFLTFIYGGITVAFAGLLEAQFVKAVLGDREVVYAVITTPIIGGIVVFVNSFIEEILKFFAALWGGLKRKTNDEPIDPVVYLITAALGFAAVENVLFIIDAFDIGGIGTAVNTSNIRFISSTLLHVASSAIIGVFIAFSYFFKKKLRMTYLVSGVIIATVLHGLFNLFIMKYNNMIFAMAMVWLLIIGIILLFEKIKNIHLEKIN